MSGYAPRKLPSTDEMFAALQTLDAFHMDSTEWEDGRIEISWHAATGRPEDEPYGGAWFTVAAPTLTSAVENAYRSAFKVWDDLPLVGT